mgnify:CR=1 FL=1
MSEPLPTVQPQEETVDIAMARLVQALTLLRALDREMSAQVLATFFFIGAHNGCLKTTLEKSNRMSTSSSSRTIDYLCLVKARKEAPEIALIEKRFDPINKKQVRLYLTDAGKLLIYQLKCCVFANQHP